MWAAAERGIHDPGLSESATDGWGVQEQRAYRLLARHPEWEAEVRSLLPADLRPSFDFDSKARHAVADHAASQPPVPRSPNLPAWKIIAPRPAAQLLSYYHAAESATGVPWAYLAAINLMETRLGRIVGVSSAGAVGPMQFLPTTWAACCQGDVNDPHDAMMGAAHYLVMRGAPDDMA
ncbi:MAG: hypothetical protein JWL70_2627 [Acidimicrobiia bacterium]|nr:hypothetical protein [Acidimicrobiia bacterium]